MSLATIKSQVCAIPCLIEVHTYLVVPPWRGNIMKCPSDFDAKGYVECEYSVLDRKGYEAGWLAKKLTPEEDARIVEEIAKYFVALEKYDVT